MARAQESGRAAGAPPGRRPRRLLLLALARSFGTATLLLVVYYLAPLDGRLDAAPLTLLVVALVALVGLIAWQVRATVHAPYPRIKAVESLFSTVPLLLLSFATTYYLMAKATPHDFSAALTRTDSLYFTITVFATVGFGDITAVTQPARVVVTVQMVTDLVVLGFGLRVFLQAIERGERRRSGE